MLKRMWKCFSIPRRGFQSLIHSHPDESIARLSQNRASSTTSQATTWSSLPSKSVNKVLVLHKVSLIDKSKTEAPVAAPTLQSSSPSFDLAADQTVMLAHREHADTMAIVQRTLKEAKLAEVRYCKSLTVADARWADLIVTVGGDGTFLRASHCVEEGETTPILGVNSSTSSSFGFFCAANGANFPTFIERILTNKIRVHHLHRMSAFINGNRYPMPVLNEVLLAANVPAAASRYILKNDGCTQFQSSSGVWIATSAGSTGAIHSAGGMIMPLTDKRLQFRVREMFVLGLQSAPHIGGFCADDFEITVRQRNAILFLDGSFQRANLQFGDRVTFRTSSKPLLYFNLHQEN